MAATLPSPFKIILGSQSIARRNILTKMGYDFTTIAADINEKGIRRENSEELVMVLAEAKANAILSKLKIEDYKKDEKPTLLITSDIVVVHEGVIREKPSSREEARLFLKGYSGGYVSTVGSVLVTNLKTGLKKGGLDIAEVYFNDIPDEVVEKLIDEGIVFHVAGGLLLEHPITQTFVDKVVGDPDSVMGLPKDLTQKLISEVVVHGGVIREKPSSKEEAREFVKGYSGGCASTVGSVLVTNLMTGVRKGGWDKTEVYFHEIPDEVIEKLIEEGAVLHVAGGLMIENPLASPFVNALVGTFDSVLGLPKTLTERLIKEAL